MTEPSDNKTEIEKPEDSYTSGNILHAYLRQIGDIPLLTPEEQEELSLKITAVLKKYRTSLYRFGFIASEHIFILRNPSGSSAADYFMPSSLKKTGKPQFLSDAAEWGDEIQKYYQTLKNTFTGNSADQKKNRSELVKSMMRYTVVYDYLEEWFKVALEYVRLAAPEFEPLKVMATDIAEDQKILLEEKMLMKTAEVIECLHETSQARTELHKLHQKILEGNLRLVISVAQRYRNKGLPLPDLIQEGNMGLMRALEKFDFELGNRFSTYATWWIKQNVTRAISSQSRVIRIPLHMINTIMAMNNAEQLFIQENGHEPSAEDLAKIMEVPSSRIGAIRKMARQAISLQAPIGSSEDSPSLEDVLSDSDSDDPTRAISHKILCEKLYQILNLLPEREQQIMIMRFGLRGHQPMSLLELSKHFELTRERIRQIEIVTLKRLREADARNFLDDIMQYK
ncbi:MAG: sigma-70 family RNA polymerase sigma factor [Victivallaceae bacterium]|nr:sigma-70 family RNA polymerase sigma factor [Victivallaceae bacterium]MDD4181779.1 sigma-70 family RNA polymerase sigma factor [Victivallaceae bacterium]